MHVVPLFPHFHSTSYFVSSPSATIIVVNRGTNFAQNWANPRKLHSWDASAGGGACTMAWTWDSTWPMYLMDVNLIWHFFLFTVSPLSANRWITIAYVKSWSASVLPTTTISSDMLDAPEQSFITWLICWTFLTPCLHQKQVACICRGLQLQRMWWFPGSLDGALQYLVIHHV